MLAGKRRGGVAAGLGFMIPGFLLMLGLSWLYFQLDLTRSALGAVFLGVQVGVLALVVRAVHRIGSHILLNKWLWAIGLASTIAAFSGTEFWLILPAAGLTYMLAARHLYRAAIASAAVAALAGILLATTSFSSELATAPPELISPGGVSALTLFACGLKAGLLTFGGAYTAIPFLRDDAVGRGWMTDAQFLDGVALSGMLPAPLIIFSTFVGFCAGGLIGALAMTAGIFLPAFGFSLLFFDRLERVVQNVKLHHFLEGVTAGVIGLIVATMIELGWALTERVPDLVAAMLIFAAALALLYTWKSQLNIVAAVLASGALGYVTMN